MWSCICGSARASGRSQRQINTTSIQKARGLVQGIKYKYQFIAESHLTSVLWTCNIQDACTCGGGIDTAFSQQAVVAGQYTNCRQGCRNNFERSFPVDHFLTNSIQTGPPVNRFPNYTYLYIQRFYITFMTMQLL